MESLLDTLILLVASFVAVLGFGGFAVLAIARRFAPTEEHIQTTPPPPPVHIHYETHHHTVQRDWKLADVTDAEVDAYMRQHAPQAPAVRIIGEPDLEEERRERELRAAAPADWLQMPDWTGPAAEGAKRPADVGESAGYLVRSGPARLPPHWRPFSEEELAAAREGCGRNELMRRLGIGAGRAGRLIEECREPADAAAAGQDPPP